MTLEQLHYFYTTAILSHMGKAAEQENISQPSLSIAIKKLEKELDVPLFQKSGRNIELTEPGKQFLPYASAILQQVEHAKAEMEHCSNRFHSKICLGYTASVACRYIPELISDFLAEGKREYLIYSDEMPSDDIRQGLEEGRFDFGICSKLEENPDIIQIPIMYQPLVLIVPEAGMLREKSGNLEHSFDLKSWKDMAGFPFVSYRQGYPMYQQISALFQENGLQPQITHYAYSEDAIARLVEHGLGISIVAETETLNMYQVRILRPEWLKAGRYIYLTYHRLHYRGKAVEEMMQFIRDRA